MESSESFSFFGFNVLLQQKIKIKKEFRNEIEK